MRMSIEHAINEYIPNNKALSIEDFNDRASTKKRDILEVLDIALGGR